MLVARRRVGRMLLRTQGASFIAARLVAGELHINNVRRAA